MSASETGKQQANRSTTAPLDELLRQFLNYRRKNCAKKWRAIK
jgi:hypothetical protein